MTDDIGLAILAELRGIHATLRQQHLAGDARAALGDAVRAALASGHFTLGGLLDLATDEPALAAALRMLVDVDAPGAAISLQRRVKHWPEFELVGERRGVQVFRLRD